MIFYLCTHTLNLNSVRCLHTVLTLIWAPALLTVIVRSFFFSCGSLKLYGGLSFWDRTSLMLLQLAHPETGSGLPNYSFFFIVPTPSQNLTNTCSFIALLLNMTYICLLSLTPASPSEWLIYKPVKHIRCQNKLFPLLVFLQSSCQNDLQTITVP